MQLQKVISNNKIFSFRFIIAPFAIFLTGKILFELLAFKFPELNHPLIEHFSKTNLISESTSLLEAKARLLWATSVVMYFFVCTVFAVFISHILHHKLTRKDLILFVSIALVFSMAELAYLSLKEDPTTSPLVTIFLFTFDSLKASGQYTEYQLGLLYSLLLIINLLAIFITPFGIMTACCIMYKQEANADNNLKNIIRQSKQIRELLAVGSAVMVIGIAHMQLWLNWPLSFLADDTARQQIEAITLVVSQYWGVIYTLTMAAIYFPTTFSLSEQARSIIQISGDEEAKKNPDLWLGKHKILLSPMSQLPQLAAVLAPMIIGSFGSTLGGIMPF